MATGTIIVLPVTMFALIVSRHRCEDSPWAPQNNGWSERHCLRNTAAGEGSGGEARP